MKMSLPPWFLNTNIHTHTLYFVRNHPKKTHIALQMINFTLERMKNGLQGYRIVYLYEIYDQQKGVKQRTSKMILK